jgi:MerR family mercuric resistance operon transcriptional regulator
MEQQANTLRIGAFAEAAGVNLETIRFYQRKGLLLEPQKPYSGIRRYGQADVARVRFVKSAQRLGFSLDEVAGLLALEDGTHCDQARQFGERKLADVRARLTDLHRIEAVLSALVNDCCARHGEVSCPLIAALQEQSQDHGLFCSRSGRPGGSDLALAQCQVHPGPAR